jgi:hypothetical protein
MKNGKPYTPRTILSIKISFHPLLQLPTNIIKKKKCILPFQFNKKLL